MATIKLAIVDDESLFRNGISFILQRENDINIIFEASDGSELIAYLKENDEHPDIIIMDLKMPLLNGVDATRIITDEFPAIKVIALTSYYTKPFIANMISIGAASYLIKNTTPQELLTTIREVSKKGYYYDEKVLEVIKDDFNAVKHIKTGFHNLDLTTREKEVIRLICMQYSTKEIADKLFINHRTVEGHRNNLMLKTESKNIAGLVVFALQHQIINLEDLL